MGRIDVTIARKGEHGLAPKDDAHTRGGVTTARIGDEVMFVFVVPGAADRKLEFTSGSPFTGGVDYGMVLRVAREGRFRYRCSASVGGRPLGTDGAGSGGEMEIIRD